MKTAEEFAKSIWEEAVIDWVTKKRMIEFAKYHVEQALKAAADKAEINYLGGNSDINDFSIDRNSILNSYNLDNIK